MIIDSHAHAFPPMGGPSGHPTARDHLRYLQHGMMFHHMPVRHISDNSIYDGPNLLYDGKDMSIDGLTDVDFRSGGYGKFAWTADSTDYSFQYLPTTLTDLEAPPELMIGQMDYVGVDKAVLQTGHPYGMLNEYLADAVKKFPDRFWGLAMVDEWRVDQDSEIQTLDHAVSQLGLSGLWFQSSNLRLHNRKEMLDDAAFRPFWDHVRELGIPVYWFVTPGIPGRDLFMDELRAFGRWLERYPDVPVMFTHGLPLFRFMDDDHNVSIPEEAWQLIDGPRVMIEILIPIFQGFIWEYPFVEARPVIQEYYQRYGADRLAWGSDMPNVERHCTYKQSLDYLRLHCDFIPDADMAKICGDNVAHLFGGGVA